MRAALLCTFLAAACGDSLVSVAQPIVQGNCPQTVNACGGSCEPCQATPANAASPMACVNSACFYECKPGYLKCASGCCTATVVAAGGDTTCAIVEGAVRCWGNNSHGQLGATAQGSSSAVPVQVAGVSGASQIAVGLAHVCAIAGGKVLCWGANDAGQLGTAASGDSAAPVVAMASGAVALAAGGRHTCATNQSGAVSCWGADDKGQRDAPAGAASALSAGLDSSCAIVSGGAVKCWGNTTAAPIASAAAALASGASHACAFDNNDVLCWGAGTSGQLGDGQTSDSSTPVKVGGFSGATGAIAAGGAHSCAVASAGGGETALFCWGANASGQLGLGSAGTPHPQAASTGLAGVTQVVAGTSHTCALTSGAVRCWGGNDQGQTGADTADTQVPSPAYVSGK